jgi:hypothetical protein
MKHDLNESLTETSSDRIAITNQLAKSAGVAARLVSIRTVLQLAGYADQSSEQVGEVHTFSDGLTTWTNSVWFLNGRISRITD